MDVCLYGWEQSSISRPSVNKNKVAVIADDALDGAKLQLPYKVAIIINNPHNVQLSCTLIKRSLASPTRDRQSIFEKYYISRLVYAYLGYVYLILI